MTHDYKKIILTYLCVSLLVFIVETARPSGLYFMWLWLVSFGMVFHIALALVGMNTQNNGGTGKTASILYNGGVVIIAAGIAVQNLFDTAGSGFPFLSRYFGAMLMISGVFLFARQFIINQRTRTEIKKTVPVTDGKGNRWRTVVTGIVLLHVLLFFSLTQNMFRKTTDAPVEIILDQTANEAPVDEALTLHNENPLENELIEHTQIEPNPDETTPDETLHTETPIENDSLDIDLTEDTVTINGRRYNKSLTSLDLSGMFLTSNDIEPLREMTQLTALNLQDNQIRNLSPLQDLTGLTSLSLWGNTISDLEPLSGLINITVLRLGDNPIRDITPLENLIKIRELRLSNCLIDDITPLERLTNLEHLTLRNNQIEDISPLQNLSEGAEVGLDFNKITDWSPVDHVENVSGRP